MDSSAGEVFAMLWIVYLFITLIIVIGVIVWAVRNNQFTKQNRASRLPMEIDEPSNPQKTNDHVSRST